MKHRSFFAGAGVVASFFLGIAFQSSQGDRIAFVETDKVIQQMPEAVEVQQKLKNIGEKWQKEFNKLKESYEKDLREYERKKSVMSQSQRKKKEEEIINKGKSMQEFQAKKMGRGGELEKKQVELFKPLEERVIKAVEKVAKVQNWSLVLSKGGLANPVLYGKKSNNITYDVLKDL